MKRIHAESRGAAGARTISATLRAEGERVGRYKAARLMKECRVASRQPRHRYKQTGGEAVATRSNQQTNTIETAQADSIAESVFSAFAQS